MSSVRLFPTENLNAIRNTPAEMGMDEVEIDAVSPKTLDIVVRITQVNKEAAHILWRRI